MCHYYQIIDTHLIRIFCSELAIIFVSFQMAINNLEQPVCSSTQYVNTFHVFSYSSKNNFMRAVLLVVHRQFSDCLLIVAPVCA